jgi:hypothetical protein
MVMDVAINGLADALVTNNVRDFSEATERFGIPVLTPRSFLSGWRRGGFDYEG